MLYNGKEECPDKVTMKLTDAFVDAGENAGGLASMMDGGVPLELTVTIININKGRNRELIEKSEVLCDYIEFII